MTRMFVRHTSVRMDTGETLASFSQKVNERLTQSGPATVRAAAGGVLRSAAKVLQPLN